MDIAGIADITTKFLLKCGAACHVLWTRNRDSNMDSFQFARAVHRAIGESVNNYASTANKPLSGTIVTVNNDGMSADVDTIEGVRYGVGNSMGGVLSVGQGVSINSQAGVWQIVGPGVYQ